MSTVSSMIRRVVWSRTLFEFWQRLGIHVTRSDYSSPIPDTRELGRRESFWAGEPSFAGIDLNAETQLHFLREVFPEYKDELAFPTDPTGDTHQFHLNNSAFGLEDASVYHCMVRHFKPRTIIEVGAGNSTLVSTRACRMNEKEGHPGKVLAVEPYPRKYLKKGLPGLERLIARGVELVEPQFFEQLDENDILFIDSSHVFRIANDVHFLYLEILPRLKKGVTVHVHDIFSPYHYPRRGVVEKQVFWTEQYLLQAFLCLNRSFEVLFANHYMSAKHGDEMHAFFAYPPGYGRKWSSPNGDARSFWFRRVT